MSTIILNDGQEQAAKGIIAYLNGDLDLPYYTLSGGPGTGKTTMLMEAIRRSNIPLNMISGATIAHAAKNVLEGSFNKELKCFTVAQWLGLKMVYDDLGSIQFKSSPKSRKRIKDYKIHILDEASMMDDELYNNTMHEVVSGRLKLIVVGRNIADVKPL